MHQAGTTMTGRPRIVAALAVSTLTCILVAGIPGPGAEASIPTPCDPAASNVPVLGYDVQDTPLSGFGGWGHTYSGQKTDTGRTFATGQGTARAALFDYSGGTGTLSDGVLGGIGATQLFVLRPTLPTGTANPQVTLHLGGSFVVDRIHLCGGEVEGNGLPGALTGLTVRLGAASSAFSTTPVGALNAAGTPRNDTVDLTGTPLAGVATDTLVLSDMSARAFGNASDQFPLTEIQLEGHIAVADTAAPAIEILTPSPNATYLLHQVMPAHYACADETGGSGLASCTGTVPDGSAVDTATAGPHTFAVGAADNKGNTARSEVPYRVGYQFAGFTAPVDNAGVMNIVKAGQAVPLKWRLTDVNGAPVTSLTTATIQTRTVACSAVETDALETVAATGSSLINQGDGYYQLNWKTPTSFADSCRELQLDLGEGQMRTALFGFTR